MNSIKSPYFTFLAAFVVLSLCSSFGRCDMERDDSDAGDSVEFEDNKIVKAKVALYMESLCPGCHSFIKHQLYPVFMKNPRYIQLDLLPFGNARHNQASNGTWIFRCQHGEPECYGNIYLACATHLHQEERPKHLIRYYNCMAQSSSYSIEKDVQRCAPEAGINFHKLDTCVKTKGPEILAKFGDRTDALKGRRFVPTVVIDDDFDINEQDDIQGDLLSYLCKHFKGKKPSDCNSKETTETRIQNADSLALRCDA